MGLIKNKYLNKEKTRSRKQVYHEYLIGEAWLLKKEEKYNQVGKKCEICGATNNLEVHHKNYENIYDEPINDLLVLCGSCHGVVHKILKVDKIEDASNIDKCILLLCLKDFDYVEKLKSVNIDDKFIRDVIRIMIKGGKKNYIQEILRGNILEITEKEEEFILDISCKINSMYETEAEEIFKEIMSVVNYAK